MSNNNNGILNLTPKSIDNIVSNIADKPTLTIGSLLDDLLVLVFGDFHQNMEKRRIKYNEDLIKFEKDTKEEISKIPPEKQIDPQTGLVLSALEASRYRVDEENLRKMFARLIANSMNSDYADYVHPSFVAIIKEMSSLDAQNIKLFKNNDMLPIANYILRKEDNAFYIQYTNVFLANINESDINKQSTSIYMLKKLGLIQTDYKSYILNKDYSFFENTQEFIELENKISHYHNMPKEGYEKLSPEEKEEFNNLHYAHLEIEMGIVELTGIGKQFVKICT